MSGLRRLSEQRKAVKLGLSARREGAAGSPGVSIRAAPSRRVASRPVPPRLCKFKLVNTK